MKKPKRKPVEATDDFKKRLAAEARARAGKPVSHVGAAHAHPSLVRPSQPQPPARAFYAKSSEPVPFPKDREAEKLNLPSVAGPSVPEAERERLVFDLRAKLGQWTPAGYDPLWLEAINGVLNDRETGITITDISEELWDKHIGPMIDAIEDGEIDLPARQ